MATTFATLLLAMRCKRMSAPFFSNVRSLRKESEEWKNELRRMENDIERNEGEEKTAGRRGKQDRTKTSAAPSEGIDCG